MCNELQNIKYISWSDIEKTYIIGKTKCPYCIHDVNINTTHLEYGQGYCISCGKVFRIRN